MKKLENKPKRKKSGSGFTCHICNKAFTSSSYLRNHQCPGASYVKR